MCDNTIERNIKEKIVSQKGLFVVKACPGSGKTLSVAERLAQMLSKWDHPYKGIAVMSFTNVAWKEIEKYISEKYNIITPISYPHFLGTIDSFINQYIFLPFGHLVMKCNTRPTLVGEPYGSWFGKNLNAQFDNFSYDSSGELFTAHPKRTPRNWKSNPNIKNAIEKIKVNFNKGGYATQLDANFFSMKILENYPQIAKALSYRFPLLMIDEAQDTSKIQMKIIDLLIKNGLKEVMLIGDTDQAIFEWRTAKPKLFLNKYDEWKENSIDLEDNYRSSQKICDFFVNISSFNKIQAVNTSYKEFDFVPEIWEYKDNNFNEVIKKFLDLCESNEIGLTPQDIAILSRSKNLLHKIRGIKKENSQLDPWNDIISKNIAKSRFFFDTINYKDAVHLLEKTVCEIKVGKRFCNKKELESIIKEYGFVQWRKEIYKLVRLLPKTKLQLGEWKEKANKVLKENQNIISDFQLKTKRDMGTNKYSKMCFTDIFTKKEVRINETEYTIGTVHSVKGETFEAVLLFVGKKAGNGQKYANVFNSKIEEDEELRTIYVAITRPRKILVVAVPEGDKEVWEQTFFEGDG